MTEGLDQYFYSKLPEEDYDEREELCYWRGHSDLHGWFCKKWEALSPDNDDPDDFCSKPILVTLEVLDELEEDLRTYVLPSTSGFFFGESIKTPDAISHDLDQIYAARRALADGLEVFYEGNW